MCLVAQVDQPESRQGPAGQVHRSPGFFGGEPQRLRLPRGPGQRPQINHGQGECRGRVDDLDRLAVHDRHCRPPDLVPPEDLSQAPLQGRHVQGARSVHRHGLVVEGQPGSDLAVQPYLMLSHGEGRVHSRGSARNDVANLLSLGNVPAQVLLEEAALRFRERCAGGGGRRGLDGHRGGPFVRKRGRERRA